MLLLALPLEKTEFETVVLFSDRFLFAVPADDPLPERARVKPSDVSARRLAPLEEGHCLRDQALTYCGERDLPIPSSGQQVWLLVLQLVATGYGVTLLPEVAVDVEVRDERVKLLRFVEPQPQRQIGLAWRPTSPRKADFLESAILPERSSANSRTRPNCEALRTLRSRIDIRAIRPLCQRST